MTVVIRNLHEISTMTLIMQADLSFTVLANPKTCPKGVARFLIRQFFFILGASLIDNLYGI